MFPGASKNSTNASATYVLAKTQANEDSRVVYWRKQKLDLS